MQVENSLKNQIEARILFKNCPLCESNKIKKTIVGDCSKHKLYHHKISPVMQWMNCEDCNHQFINGYLTDEASGLIFTKTPDYLRIGGNIERDRFTAAKIIEKVLPFKFLSLLRCCSRNGSLFKIALSQYFPNTINFSI